MSVTAQAARSRAEINRDNAQKSTGPRSAAGKERVKFNALKHGLRAKSRILPGEDEGTYRARHEAWSAILQPRDEIEAFLVDRAIGASWQLDRVERAKAARREVIRHADADRLAAQAEEVVGLGRRLYFDPVGPLCLYPHAAPGDGEPQRVSDAGTPDDPDDPARIVVRLEALPLGCAWLLDRWGELRDILEAGLLWQPHDRLKAVRMLGRQPLEAPDDPRVMAIYLCGWAMDPEDPHGFSDMANELTPAERKLFLERLNSRDAMQAMPESEEAARAALLALIAEEEERLETVLAGHLEREEAEVAAELAFDDSPYGERLRRHELSIDRALLRIIETLRKRHQDADGSRSPGGRASVRAGSVPPARTGNEVQAAIGLTDEEIRARVARIAEEVSPSPVTSAGDAAKEATDLLPSRDAARPAGPVAEGPAPLPDGRGSVEPAPLPHGRGSVEPVSPPMTHVATDRPEVPPSIDPASSNPRNVTNEPVAPGWMLAGAVLALFALLLSAGFFAASARSSLESRSANPGRETGRILARGRADATTPSFWLCSSRLLPCQRSGILGRGAGT